MWIIAQAADPISGGAGWFGAGLLGMVLGWLLLKHLPDKDRQLKELLELCRAAEKDIRAEAQVERISCQKRIDELNAKLDGLAEFMRVRAEASARRKGTIQ